MYISAEKKKKKKKLLQDHLDDAEIDEKLKDNVAVIYTASCIYINHRHKNQMKNEKSKRNEKRKN